MINFQEDMFKALWKDYLRRMHYLHFGSYFKEIK